MHRRDGSTAFTPESARQCGDLQVQRSLGYKAKERLAKNFKDIKMSVCKLCSIMCLEFLVTAEDAGGAAGGARRF